MINTKLKYKKRNFNWKIELGYGGRNWMISNIKLT